MAGCELAERQLVPPRPAALLVPTALLGVLRIPAPMTITTA
jgi:hypothetical protein